MLRNTKKPSKVKKTSKEEKSENPKKKKKKPSSRRNNGIFLEVYKTAPAPLRDYYGLHLFRSNFTWFRWKVSFGRNSFPTQKLFHYSDFLQDLVLQGELTYIFGSVTTNLMFDIGLGNWNLHSMPSDVLRKVCRYLKAKDVMVLAQVCKRLSEEVSKDEVWEKLCHRLGRAIERDDIFKAKSFGWKYVYFDKTLPKSRDFSAKNIKTNKEVAKKSASIPVVRKVQKAKDGNCPRKDQQTTNANRCKSEIFERDVKLQKIRSTTSCKDGPGATRVPPAKLVNDINCPRQDHQTTNTNRCKSAIFERDVKEHKFRPTTSSNFKLKSSSSAIHNSTTANTSTKLKRTEGKNGAGDMDLQETKDGDFRDCPAANPTKKIISTKIRSCHTILEDEVVKCRLDGNVPKLAEDNLCSIVRQTTKKIFPQPTLTQLISSVGEKKRKEIKVLNKNDDLKRTQSALKIAEYDPSYCNFPQLKPTRSTSAICNAKKKEMRVMDENMEENATKRSHSAVKISGDIQKPIKTSTKPGSALPTGQNDKRTGHFNLNRPNSCKPAVASKQSSSKQASK